LVIFHKHFAIVLDRVFSLRAWLSSPLLREVEELWAAAKSSTPTVILEAKGFEDLVLFIAKTQRDRRIANAFKDNAAGGLSQKLS
jgi:hypothetical protein